MGLLNSFIVILVVKILFLIVNIEHANATEFKLGHYLFDNNREGICTELVSRREAIYYFEPHPTKKYHVRWSVNYKCCEGYVESGLKCVPHCSQSCEDGTCEKPDVCVCDEGYEKSIDANGKESCIPVCSNGCINGTCFAPELCSCNENYWLDSDGFTCRPNCDTECEKNYGYCAEPNVCTCRSNYRRVGNDSSPFMCEPVCAVPCKNGHCVAPNVCQCANGYEPDEYDPIFTCKPKCDKPCNGGTCTSPGTCTCDQGYKLVNESFCEPICSEPCQMGTCVAPEICECKEGYELRENSKYVCELACESRCVGGLCISGNCFCRSGFVFNNMTNTCDSLCSKHCKPNGRCTSDQTCICSYGYRRKIPIFFSEFHPLLKLIKKHDDEDFCEPICDFKCIEGKCTAPNVCTCNDGYLPSWTEPQNNSDDRICTEFRPCNALSCKINERCDISGSCVCNHGYVKNVFGEGCVPSCTPPCINSNCTEPNRCTCNAGFTPRNENFCEPICKRGCQNGDCISPDHCICHKDFVQNVYNDSGPHCISPCTRNCSGHGECVIDHNLDYKCECHFGWTGEDCDQPSMCVTIMTYDHGDINRITILNDTNSTIMQIQKSAPNCYQCNDSLNKDTLCYVIPSDKDNMTSVGCLLSTDLPCYMTSHYKVSTTKIIWPFVSIAILLIIGLTVAAFVIYHKRQKKKLTGISANIFIRESYCSEVLLPENEM
ncbi:tenascin-like [Pogonomyrmex barbatus]|uniref:Tenascin-like n=1 Tax=Pogonomyrmex barbatus TaxID=144034 RepID=A0A6I9W7X7_9HYME|nr:tenascin-like [Pogonomyrmex barbatus]